MDAVEHGSAASLFFVLSSMKKHFSIRISGLVQGVFLRASTKTKADAYCIKGYVKNERDGSVYVEAEGEDKNLEEFIRWCRTGPERASVRSCEVNEGALKGFSNFVIER